MPRISDNGLLHQECKEHFPYFGHLVQEDERPFEKCVDLGIISCMDGRILVSQMFDTELQVLP